MTKTFHMLSTIMHHADIEDDRKAVAVKKRIITAGLLACGSISLGACTLSFPPTPDYDPDPVACTLISAEPLVIVELPADVLADVSHIKLTACNGHGNCTSHEQTKHDMEMGAPDLTEYYITTAWPYGEEHADVTIDLTRGDTTISSQTVVDMEMVSPNGPKCAPHVLQGSVIFDGEHWLPRSD